MPNISRPALNCLRYIAACADHTCSLKSLKARFAGEPLDAYIDQLYAAGYIDVAAYAPFDGFIINNPSAYYASDEGLAFLLDRRLSHEELRQKQNDIRAQQARNQNAESLSKAHEQHKAARHNYLLVLVEALIESVFSHFNFSSFLNKAVQFFSKLFH